MTDRSLTECYFSNPMKVSPNIHQSSSFGTSVKNKDDFIHNASKERGKFETKLGQNCVSPLLVGTASTDNVSSNNSTKTSMIKEAECKCSSLKYSYSNSCLHDFAKEQLNQDSFSHIDNIFNEKQPFDDEDSISFNEYSILRESHQLSGVDSDYDASNLLEITGPICSQTIITNKLRSPPNDLRCNLVKPFLFDSYDTDLSSRPSSPSHKDNKPIKALSQFNSKSLQDINKLFVNDKPMTDVMHSKCISKYSEPNFICTKSVNDTRKICRPIINDQSNLIRSTTTCKLDNVQNVKKDCVSLPASQNYLDRAKSISLHSLQGIRKSDYSHVQSKVKLYIQNLKQENKDKRVRETKSLPATPLKQARASTTNSINISTIQLDEKLFESLRNKTNLKDCELSEDLIILKSNLLNNIDSRDQDARLDLFETLFEQVKKERQQRFEQDVTLNKLQLDYDNLLAKYAQAENIIDKMRIYNENPFPRYHHDTFNYVSNVQGISAASAGCASGQKVPRYYLKKAFSTSNIFNDTVSPANNFVEGNLVKYSSSPIIDPNVSITLHMKKGVSQVSIDTTKDKSINSDEIDSSHTLPSQSDHDMDNARKLWMKKCQSLTQKLREYTMLEANLALGPLERESIWIYLIKLFNELSQDSKNLLLSGNCQQMLQNLHEAIIYLSLKYSLSTNELIVMDIKEAKATDSPSCKTDESRDVKKDVSGNLSFQQRTKYLNRSAAQSKDDYFKSPSLDIVAEGPNGSFVEYYKSIRFDDTLELSNHSASGFRVNNASEHASGFCGNNESSLRNQCVENDSGLLPMEMLAQRNAKDIDSGCQMSDRSTRNSPCFSIAQQLSNSADNFQETFEELSNSTDSDKSINKKEFSNKDCHLHYKKIISNNSTKIKDESLRNGYDASSSSDEDGSSLVCRPNRNKIKRQTFKVQQDSSQIVPNINKKSLKKYEDKYISRYQSSVLEHDAISSNIQKQGIKSYISDISQIKKNSLLLKSQIDGLKSKRWGQTYDKEASQSITPLKPMKPVDQSDNLNRDMIDQHYHHSDINIKVSPTESEKCRDLYAQRLTFQQKQKATCGKRQTGSKMEPSISQKFGMEVPNTSVLYFNHSMPKKLNSSNARKLAPELKFNALNKRSKSIPSLTQPVIYIEHFNCCGKHSTHYQCKDCKSLKSSLFHGNSLSSLHKLNKHISMLGSLSEATSLAEKIQQTSLTLLEKIRKDSLNKEQIV